jgi:hypothetical protein
LLLLGTTVKKKKTKIKKKLRGEGNRGAREAAQKELVSMSFCTALASE